MDSTPAMTREQIRDEIRRLAPFHHNLPLPYGLRTYVPELAGRRRSEATRFPRFAGRIFPILRRMLGGSLDGLRVLDVGCNCGGFSLEAARLGARAVLGIDVVDRYLEQAVFLRDVLRLTGVEFRKMAAEDVDSSTVGRFDVTFCFGILYHFENPILTMKKLAAVTARIMIVDTALIRNPLFRRPLWWMNFPPVAARTDRNAAVGLWRDRPVCQFTPNAAAVVALLHFLGFPAVQRLSRRGMAGDRRYLLGSRATFLGVRDQALLQAGGSR